MGDSTRQQDRFSWFRRTLLVAVLVAAMVSVPAFADSGSPVWGPFDLVDSRGIRLSQYQLSLDDGTGLTKLSVQRNQYHWIISILWAIYTGFIGLLCWLLDWTVSLSWVGWIAGPLHLIEQSLRDNFLTPVGGTRFGGALMGLLMTLGGLIGAGKVARGGASGWIDMLWSAVAGALAISIFAAPVLLFAGDGTNLSGPLRSAQQAGVAMSTMITTGKAPTTQVGGTVTVRSKDDKLEVSTDAAGKSEISMMLIDSFVRPVHQQLNFGRPIDQSDPKCAQRYDELLKAGPYDGSAKEIRKAMGDCNQDLLNYADQAASASFLVGFAPYQWGVALLGLLLLVFAGLLWASVISLMWSALCAMFNVLLAIVPGPSRTAFLRDLVSIAANLVYIVVHMVVLSIGVKLIEWVFIGINAPLQLKFVVVDVVLVLVIALLILARIRYGRSATAWGKQLASQLTGRAGRTSAMEKAANWAGGVSKSAAGNTLADTRQNRAPRMAKPAALATKAINNKTAGRALTAAGAAAAITPLGPGATIAVQGMKTARLAAVYQQARAGNPTTTTGNRMGDAAMWATSRAHNYVADTVDAARVIHQTSRTGVGPARSTTGAGMVDRVAQGTGAARRGLDRLGQKLEATTLPLVKAETQARRWAQASSQKAAQAVGPVLAPVTAMAKPPTPAHPRRATPTVSARKPPSSPVPNPRTAPVKPPVKRTVKRAVKPAGDVVKPGTAPVGDLSTPTGAAGPATPRRKRAPLPKPRPVP